MSKNFKVKNGIETTEVTASGIVSSSEVHTKKISSNGHNIILEPSVGKNVGIFNPTPSHSLTVTGDISASGDIFLHTDKAINFKTDTDGSPKISFQNNNSILNINSNNIHLNANNSGVSIGAIGGNTAFKADSFYENASGFKLTTPNLLNFSSSKPSEINFTNTDIGGASGTDTISGSTIGVISFAGNTEFDDNAQYDTYEDGAAEAVRLMSHIRGGVRVYQLPGKDTKFKTGGILSFHTAADSRSYAGASNAGLSVNERMRIDATGRVGIGFQEMNDENKFKARLQVRKTAVISSSIFTNDDPGPSISFKGLRNSSSNAELPHFKIVQVRSQHQLDDSEFDTNSSSSLEIQARRHPDGTELGNIAGIDNSNAPLPMMHFRTYERNFNPTDLVLHASNSIEPAHQGANIGFNMNNPDGFNVNIRRTTLGLSDASATKRTTLAFRGDSQFLFEGTHHEEVNLGALDVEGEDIGGYIYDEVIPPDDGEDDNIELTLDIQVNPPDGADIPYIWKSPTNPDNLDSEIPLTWQWAWADKYVREFNQNGLQYSATGSIISGSISHSMEDNDGYTTTQRIWQANSDGIANPNFDYELISDPSFVAGFFSCYRSGSDSFPSSSFPIFPDDGANLSDERNYKWKIELNKTAGPTNFTNGETIPTNIVATSSAAFNYTGSFPPGIVMGDVNQDESINVLDVVRLVNIILEEGFPATDEEIVRGDMNQDGILNILDVIQLVNIILGTRSHFDEQDRNRGYDLPNNKVFRERQVEKTFLTNFKNDLSSSGVILNVSTGSNTQVSSSLKSFITASSNFLSSGSKLTSIGNIYNKHVKPKLGANFGYNFIESISGSTFNLNGVQEGSSLLFNNALVRNVEQVFITTSNNVHYVKLDNALPSSSIGGLFYKEFKPHIIGGRKKPIFLNNRTKPIRKNKGLIIRQSDGRIGVGTTKPTAFFHISASDTGSGGKINDTLFKIERPDGTEYKVTEEEIKFKDKLGNVSRRKFNSKGQEVMISGSDDTSDSELNQIIFDQTGDGANIILSGSTNSNTILNFVGPTALRQDKPTSIVMRDTQIGSNSTHMIFNTGSGILDIGFGTVVGGGGIRINPSNNVEISGSLELNANTHITASGNISASGDTILNTVQLTNITASGEISASGDLIAEDIGANNIVVNSAIFHGGDLDTKIAFNDDRITIQTGNVNTVVQEGHITASGNISASGTIEASVFKGSVVNVDGFSAIDTSTSPERIVYGNTTTETRLIGDGGGFLHISESNVGIGTTFPPEKLTVAGNISSSGATIHDVKTISAGDTTPDVSNGTVFKTSNALVGTTTITGFDNGTAGQIIHIMINDSNTDFTNGTNLQLFKSVNATSLITDDVISFICFDGTKWLELNRSDNS